MVVELSKSGKSSRGISRYLDIPLKVVRRRRREFSVLLTIMETERQSIDLTEKFLFDFSLLDHVVLKATFLFVYHTLKYIKSKEK
jgi:hypothetical protein